MTFYLKTASTAILEKKSLCWERIFELNVVLAMFIKSSLNFSGSVPWSNAFASKTVLATFVAFLHPATIVWGWILISINFSAYFETFCKYRKIEDLTYKISITTHKHWIFVIWLTSFNSSDANTTTDVVPSPTSSS